MSRRLTPQQRLAQQQRTQVLLRRIHDEFERMVEEAQPRRQKPSQARTHAGRRYS